MTAWLLAIAMVIAMIRRVEVYTAFTAGAREGMETAMHILPGLAAIFVALRMLEASGLMHALCGALAPVAAWLGLPEGVMPLLLLRPLSGSASLGMLADILRQYGPDSRTGLVASAMMGSGETVMYTCALYLAAASSAFFGPSPVSVFVFPSFAPQAASASTISAASSSAVSFFSFILFPPCFFLK